MKSRQFLCFGVFSVSTLLAAVALLCWQPTASAVPGLRAKIFLTQKGIPKTLSERGVLKFAASHRVTKLGETKEVPIPKRYWSATMVASFNQPVNDTEFEVLFYDTETGQRKFIAPTTVFLSNRNERTVVHKLRLKRPEFKPNRRIEMVLTVRRQEVARYSFQILGDQVKHSGEVTFDDDETR